MFHLNNNKKDTTEEFYKAFIMGDNDEQFNLWLNDDFNPNKKDCFGEPLIMNILCTYTGGTLKINESDFKETVSLVIGHEKYDPNQTNDFGEIPLFAIARNKELNCVAKALLSLEKTDLTKSNDAGVNIYESAMISGNYEFMEMLLNTGKFNFMTKGQCEIYAKDVESRHAQ